MGLWAVRRELGGSSKGVGKKGRGKMKMKMKTKTEGGVLPHIIIYVEEEIFVWSARALRNLNINLHHRASPGVWELIRGMNRERNSWTDRTKSCQYNSTEVSSTEQGRGKVILLRPAALSAGVLLCSFRDWRH
jgi:hypothetical protein